MKKTVMMLIVFSALYIIAGTGALSAQDTPYFLRPVILGAGGFGYQFYAIAVGDVTGDGRDDAIVTGADTINFWEYPYFFVFVQDDDGTFERVDTYQFPGDTSAQCVVIADVNSDGRNDAIFPADGIGLFIYYQTADDDFTDAPITVSGDVPFRLCTGNFDNDGENRTDICGATSYGEVFFYYQNADGTMGDSPGSYSTNNPSVKDIATGDFNGDGLDDVAYSSDAGSSNACLGVLFQDAANGMSPPNEINLVTNEFIGSIGAGDITNDGFDDLLAVPKEDAATRSVRVYEQTDGGGPLSTTATLLPGVDYFNRGIAAFDIDHDNDNDVVASQSGHVAIYLQDSTVSPGVLGTELQNYGPGITLHSHNAMRYGDLNGDGWTDLAFFTNSNTLTVMYGHNGTDGISITSPVGGTVYVGENRTIQWATVGGNITYVNIFLSIDNGVSWTVVAQDIANSGGGTYTWRVPYTYSDQCKIRVTNVNGPELGETVMNFSIEDDGIDRIEVSSPNGGESLVASSTWPITWFKTGTGIPYVDIEYSTDNGANWTTVVASTENDGAYDWDIPNALSSTCLIRISDVAGGGVTDMSDNNFSILAAGSRTINIAAPNGGEGIQGGSTYNIRWTSTGSIFVYRIELSTDNGASYPWTMTYSPTSPGDTSHSIFWAVPNVTSNQCLLRISDESSSSIYDISDSTFSIGSYGASLITLLSPNGGEMIWVGSSYPITWTSSGSVGAVRLQYSTNNGSSWNTIVASTSNDGVYYWTVPNVTSTNCLVRIEEAADGDPYDVSNAVFTIQEQQPALSITSPLNGDYLQVGTTHDITWTNTMTVGNVKLEYSTDAQATWSTIASSTANDGSYTWTVPNTPSDTCNVKISEAADGSPSNISYGNFSIVTGSTGPEIHLNRTQLNFAAMKSSLAQTGKQTIIVNNTGPGSLRWKATKYGEDEEDPAYWLILSNTTGTQSDTFDVSVKPFGIEAGTYTGTIDITDSEATNSPQTISVTFTVLPSRTDKAPFGTFDTPAHGSTVMSSIPVTGWVLDDIGVEELTIWRDPVSGEGGGQIYIGDAILVPGARPDVEAAYPDYPMNYQAGWGYMMLTNALPNKGNGTFKLYAYATDGAEHKTLLGTKTITCDNANAVKPFGAIDTPSQGGIASGTNFRNQGWVLTPMPNSIPTDGSTIKVYIDGQVIGQPTYNIYRYDIATFFPGYANSNGALAYYDFDTTAYMSGLHTIQWTAVDSAGNTDGIGSRFFMAIQNSGYQRANTIDRPQAVGKNWHRLSELASMPLERSAPLRLRKGYLKPGAEPGAIETNPGGIAEITAKQDQRLVLNLAKKGQVLKAGYMLTHKNSRVQPLPTGSSIDRQKGVFYWQISSAHFKTYNLVFVLEDSSGKSTKRPVNVTVETKYKNNEQ